MADLFKAKIRKIGTSAGIIIPNEYMKREKMKIGETVEFKTFRPKNLDEVLKLFGTSKGAKPFVRDKTDRLDKW